MAVAQSAESSTEVLILLDIKDVATVAGLLGPSDALPLLVGILYSQIAHRWLLSTVKANAKHHRYTSRTRLASSKQRGQGKKKGKEETGTNGRDDGKGADEDYMKMREDVGGGGGGV